MEWEALLEQVNISDYIKQYTELEEDSGELWGACPLHNEKTPSFSINEEKQTFYCFGCNSGGTLISFIMQYDKCDFVSALNKIKEFYKIKDDGDYKEVPEIIRTLKKFKVYDFNKTKDIRDKVNDSDIDKYSKEDIIEWEKEGISQQVMDYFNVRYNKNDNSIIFEVRGNDGKLISLKERTLNSHYKRKYTYVSKIGYNDFLWGFYKNRENCVSKKEIILVESEKSVMKLMSWGINNCAAICTSHISDEQLQFLIESKLNVVVALDKDNNGQVLKDVMWNKLKRFCKVYVILDKDNLIDEKDAPVDKGLEVWSQLYNKKKILS